MDSSVNTSYLIILEECSLDLSPVHRSNSSLSVHQLQRILDEMCTVLLSNLGSVPLRDREAFIAAAIKKIYSQERQQATSSGRGEATAVLECAIRSKTSSKRSSFCLLRAYVVSVPPRYAAPFISLMSVSV